MDNLELMLKSLMDQLVTFRREIYEDFEKLQGRIDELLKARNTESERLLTLEINFKRCEEDAKTRGERVGKCESRLDALEQRPQKIFERVGWKIAETAIQWIVLAVLGAIIIFRGGVR